MEEMEEQTGMPDNDFKYIMQDTGNIYIGARFSYQELLEHEMVPFKLKTIISRYLLPDVSQEMTLEHHMQQLPTNTSAFLTYKELRAKVKLSMPETYKTLFGGPKTKYVDHIYTMDAMAALGAEELKQKNGFVRELVFTKMSLLAFSV